MDRSLLILDVDEVLIYSTEYIGEAEYDFEVATYCTRIRPFAKSFIKAVFNWYNVAVWSSATTDYLKFVLGKLIPNQEELQFVWARDRCTFRYDSMTGDHCFLKDLKKVKRRGYDLNRILVVEDDPRATKRNYGNLIKVTPYYGNPHDRELSRLAEYLKDMSDVENVRKREKRNWRINCC